MSNKESLELVVFLAELINGIERSERDGKITWLDATNFINAAISAPAAFTGLKNLPAEFKSWTDVERIEVIASFKAKLAFENDISEQEVEAVFGAALNLAAALNNLLTKNDGLSDDQPTV